MIKILCASTGGNLKLGNKVKEILAAEKIAHELLVLEDFNLPLYSARAEENNGIPEQAVKLADQVKEALGLVVIAPEYNGSIPPILNNSIAWISRSSDDWRSAFNGKFALVMSHSGGGGQKVILAMKQQLEHIGCNTLARTFLSTAAKEVNEKGLTTALKKLNNIVNS